MNALIAFIFQRGKLAKGFPGRVCVIPFVPVVASQIIRDSKYLKLIGNKSAAVAVKGRTVGLFFIQSQRLIV